MVVVNLAANYWLPDKLARWSDPPYHVRRELLVRRYQAALSTERRLAPPLDEPANPTRIVAAFGSSRFMGGLNGKSLEEVFQRETGERWFLVNFGSAGGGPIDSLLRLRRLLAEGPRPDYVLIEVLPNQLSSAPGHSSPISATAVVNEADHAYCRDLGITFAANQNRAKTHTGCALWDFRQEFLRMVFPRLLHGGDSAIMLRACDAYGTIPIESDASPERRRRALLSAHGTFHDGASQFRAGGDGLIALEAVLRICQDQNLPASLVIMPEGPAFRQWYRAGAADELRATIQDLAARGNARVIDRWDDLPEDAFLDSHHLLAGATGEFTTRLAQESLTSLHADATMPRISAGDILGRRR